MKMIALIGCSFVLSCANIKSKAPSPNRYCNALDFLMSKDYNYSISKTEIPVVVIDSLSRINKEVFKIGDITDSDKISLSDASLNNYELKRKLHFILLNDTVCLISYAEGGIGSHDVVDYIKYKGEFNHTRYITTDILSDTVKLRNYLKGIGLSLCPPGVQIYRRERSVSVSVLQL